MEECSVAFFFWLRRGVLCELIRDKTPVRSRHSCLTHPSKYANDSDRALRRAGSANKIVRKREKKASTQTMQFYDTQRRRRRERYHERGRPQVRPALPRPYPPPPVNPFLVAAQHSQAQCIPVREMSWTEAAQYAGASGGAPPSVQQRFQQTYAKQNLPFGRPTRGWYVMYPRRGSQRHELAAACGDKCFLSPRTEGFPICAQLGIPAAQPAEQCLPMRQGIQAAYNRARQWRHEQIADEAQAMLQHVCTRPLSDMELNNYLSVLRQVDQSSTPNRGAFT
jgi:hypothetical protein